MNENNTRRKTLRLKDFDYSSVGAYFITICTKNRQPIFGPVGADSISARMLKRVFTETVMRYEGIEAPAYVVMPNHFHAIITISRADMESAPTISQIVQSFKRYSTIEYTKMVKNGMLPPYNKHIWQRSFYDHVIRNQQDYDEIFKYILENPLKWEYDRFYC